jgi:hypothetical protein
MEIWGITESGLQFALAIGSAHFGGNVKFVSKPKQKGRAWQLRLSHVKPGPGSKVYTDAIVTIPYALPKRSKKVKKTRIGPAVCYCVYREFIRAIFDINETARVKTSLATYSCKADFDKKVTTDLAHGHCTCLKDEPWDYS